VDRAGSLVDSRPTIEIIIIMEKADVIVLGTGAAGLTAALAAATVAPRSGCTRRAT
jgi:aspartate oxidase